MIAGKEASVGHRRWFWLVGAVFGAALLAGAAPAQKTGGTLRLGFPHDESVDPAIAYLPEFWMLEYATCAKLYNYPDKLGQEGTTVVPEVATDFPRFSKDEKTQTIALKKTYRFHTGARITAANFVAAFNRDANPKLASAAAGSGYLNEIVGAKAVMDGTATTISGVKAIGPYVLQIRTTRPLHDLTALLTFPFFCPIAVNTPPKEIDDPLGSGPYYVASYIRNREVTLERNRFYRGHRPANVDHIVANLSSSPATCRA